MQGGNPGGRRKARFEHRRGQADQHGLGGPPCKHPEHAGTKTEHCELDEGHDDEITLRGSERLHDRNAIDVALRKPLCTEPNGHRRQKRREESDQCQELLGTIEGRAQFGPSGLQSLHSLTARQSVLCERRLKPSDIARFAGHQ